MILQQNPSASIYHSSSRIHHSSHAKNRFIRIEIIFFLVYFFLFNILTDIEYNLYENHNYTLFLKEIPDRLIYGIVYIIPFWICYKTLIQGYLFEKKYFKFALLLILFLVLLNFYFLYAYWLLSKLSFLPYGIVSGAKTFYHAKVPVHFSIIYIIRELLVISSLAFFIKSVKQEQLMNTIMQEQLQSELRYLKAQLQPHFFFNTLNNIYALSLQGSAAAAPLIAKHSDMMRYILYDATRQQVKLMQEIEFLKNYAQVESIRYTEKISVGFDTQGINCNANIEPLLLLPFVENAFKHGVREETDTGYVKIIICVADDELTLEVMNSKAACKNSLTPKKGIGLENVTKRLKLLYPQKHQLVINENNSVYEVRLTLKLASDG
ncbi:MAG: histidine kinase [Bacteroidota bacterium]|nr:histidine kinase [Bacteroidota bacterium]MDP4248501.1 histidine kinase [Bacteroidota bacterium]